MLAMDVLSGGWRLVRRAWARVLLGVNVDVDAEVVVGDGDEVVVGYGL